MVIPANTGPFYFPGGHFRPQGKIRFVGGQKRFEKAVWNPPDWSEKDMLSARLVVGFSVGQESRFDLDDLMKLTKIIRLEQKADPSATFVAQKGVCKHDTSGEIVTEDGGQVIIINFERKAWPAFRDEMIDLAEQIAACFEQESVLLEYQKSGRTYRSCKVTPW